MRLACIAIQLIVNHGTNLELSTIFWKITCLADIEANLGVLSKAYFILLGVRTILSHFSTIYQQLSI